jgi:hypothetical protein
MNTKSGTYGTRYKTTALAVLLTAFGMSAYGWSVSGTVKILSDGIPLSGVAVTVKDSSKYSTSTNENGNFKLESAVSILNSRTIGNAGSYSAQVIHGELIVRSPRDEVIKLSLLNCLGRTVLSSYLTSSQGVAKIALPSDLGRGMVFLSIHHANGTEYKALGWGLNCGSGTVCPRSVAYTAAVAVNPIILFKKSGYNDTSFAMTSENMNNVSIVMTPVATQNCSLPTTLKWQSSGILVNIHPDTKHPIVSVKDPTIQKYNGKYLIYCTVYNTKSVSGSSQGWSMQFIQFTDFSQADAVTPVFMDQISGFSGYKCAPELFYFEPKKIWYLIWQQQDPAYSTTTTPDNPNSWSAPKKFYPNGLSSISLPIDYFPIADDSNFYLFFTGDDGSVYRAKTTLADFPNGFGTPVKVKTLATSIIFEGSSHYKIKGTANTYLHLVEGMGSTGRVYSAWTSEGIEGAWKDYKVGSDTPFAGRNNVTYASGATDWTDDVSHGELLRDNPNQKQEVDPCHFQLLYQGKDPKNNSEYSLLPYRLGLLTAQ